MTAYIIKTSLSLIILFGLYWFFLRKEKTFVFNRFFLLSAVVFSLLMPFISIPVKLQKVEVPGVLISIMGSNISEMSLRQIPDSGNLYLQQSSAATRPLVELSQIFMIIYFSGVIILLIRFLRNILFIFRQKRSSEVLNIKGQKLVLTDHRINPFCFFNTIFINNNDYLNKKFSDELLAHELEHIRQLHSADIIFMELIQIIYWFNPILILYNRAVRINHEFMADEGAIRKSDIKNYVDTLLSFASYKKSISLISGFNHSLTRKRLIMITKSYPDKTRSGIWIFFTLSLALCLVLIMSFKNPETSSSENTYPEAIENVSLINDMDEIEKYDGKEENGVIEIVAKEKLTKPTEKSQAAANIQRDQAAVVTSVAMNVLYRGISNPVEIAVPGITSDKVTAEMTNGTIKRSAHGWEVLPGDKKMSVITVLVNNKKVSEKTFRIKDIPVPLAVFHGKNHGSVARNIAAKEAMIEAEIKDFDFDVKFEIVSFSLFMSTDSADIEVSTTGNKLNDKMKSMISGLGRGQNLIFKDITAVGPDGNIYNLSPIILKID
jgi:beta-lactamase regulating signal transducer with metallopeptidase domain